MTSSFVLDASFTPGATNGISDIAIPKSFRSDSLEDVRTLRVPHSNLVSLISAPDCTLHAVVTNITTLDASHNFLHSLQGIDCFRQLEVLHLAYNQIHVLDATSTALLRALPFLREVDLSHNQMRLVDWDIAASEAPPAHRSAGFMRLTALNLNHNELIEVPDLRALPALQVLSCNHNKIEDLTDLELRLPLLALESLHLRNNRLAQVSHLVPLAGLAQTLHHVQLYGNPFSLPEADDDGELSASLGSPSSVKKSRRGSLARPRGDQPFWWRPFVLFLLPLIETVDLVELTRSERQAAGGLFRERGALSKKLLELMNTQQRDELVSYLCKQAERVLAPADMMDILTATEEEEEEEPAATVQVVSVKDVQLPSSHSKAPAAAPRLGSSQSRHSGNANGNSVTNIPNHNGSHSNVNNNGSASYSSVTFPSSGPRSPKPVEPTTTATTTMSAFAAVMATPAPTPCNADGGIASRHGAMSSNASNSGRVGVAEVVRAMQQKLKSLMSVVETLYKADMVRRHFAAIVIQKYMRSALQRMHLSEEEAQTCNYIRQRLDSCSRPAERSAALPEPLSCSPSAAADIHEVLQYMRGLQEVITQMWGDMDDYKLMLLREQNRAAQTIQRYYRGYVARQQYRILRDDYKEFVASLEPYVQLLQSAGRGYLRRCHVARQLAPAAELRRLRTDVKCLQEQMAELRSLMGVTTLPVSSSGSGSGSGTGTGERKKSAQEQMNDIIRNHERRSGPLGHAAAREVENPLEEVDATDELLQPSSEASIDATPDRLNTGHSTPKQVHKRLSIKRPSSSSESKSDAAKYKTSANDSDLLNEL